jgi:hypothetical protein
MAALSRCKQGKPGWLLRAWIRPEEMVGLLRGVERGVGRPQQGLVANSHV